MKCHSCESRNPDFVVPAPVFFLGKRQLEDIFWIPAFAGMTDKTPSPGGAFGTAGLSRKGERRGASFG